MDALYLHKKLSPHKGKPQQAQSEAMHKEKLPPQGETLFLDHLRLFVFKKALL